MQRGENGERGRDKLSFKSIIIVVYDIQTIYQNQERKREITGEKRKKASTNNELREICSIRALQPKDLR